MPPTFSATLFVLSIAEFRKNFPTFFSIPGFFSSFFVSFFVSFVVVGEVVATGLATGVASRNRLPVAFFTGCVLVVFNDCKNLFAIDVIIIRCQLLHSYQMDCGHL